MIGVGMAFAAMALGVVSVRVVLDSRAALARGDAAAVRGDAEEAVRRYLEAVRLYAPGSPFPAAALDRLGELSRTAEGAGDLSTARLALEAARSGILGIRSLYTPFSGRLPAIEERLASLYARLEAGGASGRAEGTQAAEGRVAAYAQRLARHPGPSLPFALLALAGFGTWVAAAIGFLTRGLDESVRLRPRAAAICGAVFLVGLALFLAGLRLS